MKKIALVDAYGFVFRAFHSLPPLSRSDGTPVGAVYGFTNMLIKLLAGLDVSHIAVVFDSGSKTFRNEIYPAYKANRPPCPEELKPQFPLVRSCAESLNLPVLEKVGYEADDVIATIAKKSTAAGLQVLVISSDKDLMQLVNDQVLMFDAMKNRLISKLEVKEKFSVEPSQVLDVLSLIGDASDNIPGVRGIGPKTAAELILQFGNLENLLNNLDEIKQNRRRELLIAGKESAILSKRLATLDYEVELKTTLQDLEIKPIEPEKFIKFLQEQDFRSLILKVKKEFGLAGNHNSVGVNNGSSDSKAPFNDSFGQSYNSEKIPKKKPEENQETQQNQGLNQNLETTKTAIFPSKQKISPIIRPIKTISELKILHQIAQKNGQITVDYLVQNDEFQIVTFSTSDNLETPKEVFWWEIFWLKTFEQKNNIQNSIENGEFLKNKNLPVDSSSTLDKPIKSEAKFDQKSNLNSIADLPLFANFSQNNQHFQSDLPDSKNIELPEKSAESIVEFINFLPLLTDNSIRKIIFDSKAFLRSFKNYFRFTNPHFCNLEIVFDDVKLQNYLLNSSIHNNLRSLIDSNLDMDFEDRGFGEILKRLEEQFEENSKTEFEDDFESEVPSKKNPEKPIKSRLEELFLDSFSMKDFFYCKNIAIFQLSKIFAAKLFQNRLIGCYLNYELPLIPVLAQMEFNGIRIDSLKMKDLSLEFGKKITELSGKIYQLAGEEFNIASNKQLNQILFEKLGLTSSKKSKKTGALSTRARVLDELAEEGHEIAVNLREFRKFYKLKNTYTDALPKAVNPKTNRIHSHFSNLATITGRLSSSNPNLQNIPIKSEEGKKIRELFVAETGKVLIFADYSQIELRVIAHMANVSELILAFKQDRDIHRTTAADVFGISEKEVDENLRNKAKAINFGIIYGISPFGLAKQLKISTSEASDYINSYLKTYPGIAEFMGEQVELAHKNGFVQTISGRKCFIKNIHHENRFIRAEGERQALNAPVQGSAADIIKKAMISLQKRIEKQNLEIKLVLQIHDELVIETKQEFADLAVKILKQEMEKSYELLVPLKVDLKIR